MQRVFVSNLDQAPGRAVSHVFRCYGYEVYGTVQDDDESQPAPAEAHKIIPSPMKDLAEFQRGILSCSIVVYDLTRPAEAVAALECCAGANNQRKFVAISSFMTWARTELPEKVEEDNGLEDPDDLPNEKEMEPQEVAELYKAAKQPVPQWVQNKLAEIKRKEREERLAELAERGEEAKEVEPKEETKEPEPENEADAEKGEEQPEEHPEEELEEEEEKPDPEEALLKLSEYGFKETDFATRKPHADFREQYEAENTLIHLLETSQNITGCIVTPGIIYGYGETVMTGLYKRFYKQITQKAPLYYGGHKRIIPFVHALDLAILIHAMTVEQFPDKSEPFVFAVERQQVTARQFSEELGMKLLTDDPKREQIIRQLAKEKRETKPKPMTQQTYKVWLANLNKPQAVPRYVEEISRDKTALEKDTVKELTQNCPMQLGFAANDLLEGKWPLFARAGVLEHIEVSWTEFLHVWGLEPVRILIQMGPKVSRRLGLELGAAISQYLDLGNKEFTQEDLVRLAETVGRSSEQSAPACGKTPVVEGSKFTADELTKLLVHNRRNRTVGYVLLNLPQGVQPDGLFGKPAVSNVFEFYADTGIKPPRRFKPRENQDEDAPEEEEKPEWLAEDVEIDADEKIKLIRERILLPYTAPRNLFTFSAHGKQRLAQKPHEKHEFLDPNVCLEHPAGLRFPAPKFVIDLPPLFRYEGETEENGQSTQALFEEFGKRALQLYRDDEYAEQLQRRKAFIENVKKQLIKIILRKTEQEEFDEEGYNWTEEYSLLGLDPRLDLGSIRIPKKDGVPDEPEEEELDEDGKPIPKPPKVINPDDYNLGIEDIQAYVTRQEEQAARRLARRQRNASRRKRTKAGEEEVSELEEEESEPQVDENGNPFRTQPKLRPFIQAPKIMKLEEIPEPEKHPYGLAWLIALQQSKLGFKTSCLSLQNTRFSELCLEAFKFLGRPRDFPASKEERKQRIQKQKLQEEIKRRIEEEKAMRAQEEHRLAEERRVEELQFLREKYQKDEERRVLELAVPLRKYISQAVLGDLIDGLVETAKIRPADPVRFLGEFLMDRAVVDIQ